MLRCLVCLIVAAGAAASADPLPAALRVHAMRRVGAISIDGHLDEPAWATAPRQTGFIQRFPKDGVKATQDTSFAIQYDDDAIYVGVWADDEQPALIRALLTRRDVDGTADAVAIGFDSYHDRRTAFVFQLNAAGVQRDQIIFDDTSSDDTWDAVWTGDSALTAHGWTAEFRIPLNQLRFAGGDNMEWGFQIIRFVGRTQEQSTWSPWPRSSPQIVSKFGIVDGIAHVEPGRRLELVPYVLGGFDVAPVDAGDTVDPRTSGRFNAGLDLKYGLGHAFTLSATLNPDFGQVEADPSLVNLSPNEPFFAEKRPFFLEGIDLFKLPVGVQDNSTEGAFYSRRIGAAPDISNLDYEYIHAPTATTIYGAAKLTGKTSSGWSLGALDAVTGQESAAMVDITGLRSDPIVSPLTNYAVGRIVRDLNNGETSIGMSATAVDRALDGTPLVETLDDQAYTGGVQVKHRWDDNAWQLDFHAVASWIHGSEDAIAYIQELNRHLFQRPDATDVSFDPTRRSMAGADAYWKIGQYGDTKHWRYWTGGEVRTPGLELNDVGFQTASDQIIPYVDVQYRDDAPGDYLLNWQVTGETYFLSNLEPTMLFKGGDANFSMQLASYWVFNTGFNLQSSGWDPVALRGGDKLRIDPNINAFVAMSTDSRKRIRIDLSGNINHNPTTSATGGEVDLGATIQARSNVDLYFGPTFFARTDPLQYIDQTEDAAGAMHYLFGRIVQRTTSMTVRVNWTFSPHLSLQGYAQPFIATGSYDQLKDVDNPHASRFTDRYTLLRPGVDYQVVDDSIYADRNGAYVIARPDFDLRQMRSTVVLRWEYRPGSTVFVIWNHGQTNTLDDGTFRFGHDLAGLAGADSENLVMVKANYWIGL